MNSVARCIWMRMAMSVFMAIIARDCFCMARSTDERNVWAGLRQGLKALEGDVKTMAYKKCLESSVRSYERDNFDALKFMVDCKDLSTD